jgi:hypothetical protein
MEKEKEIRIVRQSDIVILPWIQDWLILIDHHKMIYQIGPIQTKKRLCSRHVLLTLRNQKVSTKIE